MKARTLLFPTLFVAAVLVLTGCKKEDHDAQDREFKVRMTDGPGDYTSLNVKVISIDAYHEDGIWVNLSNDTRSLDVLTLTNGEETILAEKKVKSGIYSKLRITFAQEASVKVTEAGDVGGDNIVSSNYNLNWTGTTEVIVDIKEKVNLTNGANVLVDFNVAASIKENDGEYFIDPVVTVIEDEATGIKGDVDGSAHAVVMLMQGDNKISTYTDISGNFLMRGVPAGTYNLVVIPETEGVIDNGTEYHIDGLVIDKGIIKNLGTINI